MTVSTTHVENSFTGDGATVVFDFTFHTQKATEIQVRLAGEIVDSDDYTVTLNPNQESAPGGTVEFDTAPDDEIAGLIQRNTSTTQDVAFTRESLLDIKSLEKVFDKLTLLLQEAAARTQGETGPQGEQGPQGDPGSMTGPGSATNNALAVFNGTSGSLLKVGAIPANEGDILQVVSGAWAATASAASIPSGAIMLWDTNMAAVPTGWEPMDGRTVTINGNSRTTVDTRGKYVLAASEDDTGSSGYTGSTVRPGTVSGTKTHQHDQGGTVSTGFTASTGSVSLSSGGTFAAGFAGSAAFPTIYSLSMNLHNHTAAISGQVQANLESSRPIEAAFLLIIKVDE